VDPFDSEGDGNNWIWQSDEQDYVWEFCSDATVFDLNLTLQSSTGQNINTVLACTGTPQPNGCASDTLWRCELTSSWTNGTIWWYPIADNQPYFDAAGMFNTGPSAVALSGFGADSGLALALVLPLVVLGAVVYTKRQA
jgi:hypothetical protein